MFLLKHLNGILDLYNKEKEKYKELLETCYRYEDKLGEYENTDVIFLDKYFNLEELRKEDEIGIKGKRYISKDKIREKIEKLEKIKKEEEKTKFVLSYSIYNSITNEIDDLKELLEE